MSQIVVALGGNALLENGQGSIADQRSRIRRTVPHLAELDDRGDELVITHGNGPQVGQLLLQNEESTSVDSRPLDVLVAESQAQIGYLLQQELHGELGTPPATVVTRTLVDPADPAFQEPTKRIGPFYDETEAATKGFPTKEDTDEDGNIGFRRVVASPRPLGILESAHVERLADSGRPVICVGGGGIPVAEENTGFVGRNAVVDKDHASEVLATELGASVLLFLTDVEAAYRNFGTPHQERIAEIKTDEARALLEDGEFGEGSMAPKVEASVDFVERGGRRAVITAIESVTDGLDGRTGTTIVPSAGPG